MNFPEKLLRLCPNQLRSLSLSSQNLDAHNGISNLPPPNTNQAESQAAELQPEPPRDLDLFLESLGDTSDSDCGYEGGVNIDVSDIEYVLDEHDSEFIESELSEFDEEIIEALKLELAALSKPTAFEELNQTKSKKYWKKDFPPKSSDVSESTKLGPEICPYRAWIRCCKTPGQMQEQMQFQC
ncbi:hypothetical protein B0H17DRAFT_1133842 [Mycena rosella]|uniref:Uncharacterized protein n=1 Tax=Mycena rosella TaxID=1033263 RepID=A0AAD7DH94_MYCRO|nr:hypothetical protein B0H17DRAFT_1133842 [Mycena rosella]